MELSGLNRVPALKEICVPPLYTVGSTLQSCPSPVVRARGETLILQRHPTMSPALQSKFRPPRGDCHCDAVSQQLLEVE
jgi:hypothetical protein